MKGIAELSALIALAAASCVSLPSAEPDPEQPPFEGGLPSDRGSVLVEYFVACRGCDIVFSTPRGPEAVEESDGLRRRIRFGETGGSMPNSVTLRVEPAPGEYVIRASIRVDGYRVAEVDRDRAGTYTDEAVVLTAHLRGPTRPGRPAGR